MRRRVHRRWAVLILGLILLPAITGCSSTPTDDPGAAGGPNRLGEPDSGAPRDPMTQDDMTRSGGPIDRAQPIEAALVEPGTSSAGDEPGDGPMVPATPADRRFASPTGNITCGHEILSDTVACSISSKRWRVRAEHLPDNGRCRDDGREVELRPGRPSAFACRDEEPWYLAGADVPVLDYGDHVFVGSYVCVSETKGLSCWEGDAIRSGFTLASDVYPLLHATAEVDPSLSDLPTVGQPGDTITVPARRVRFTSRSGDVVCGISLDESTDTGVRPHVMCSITVQDWAVRPDDVPTQDGAGPCDLDYGDEVRLDAEGAPSFTCRSDVSWYQPPDSEFGSINLGALSDGVQVAHGPFRCLSEAVGLSCWRGDDPGTGFVMSRRSYPF